MYFSFRLGSRSNASYIDSMNMKKTIRRFFGLDEDQLKGKQTKFTGWFCVFLGCAFFVGSIAFYSSYMPMATNWEWKVQRCIQHIKRDAEVPQNNLNIIRTLQILDSLSDETKLNVKILVIYLVSVGLLFGLYGMLSLKVYSVLNKEPSCNTEREIVNPAQPHLPTTENSTMTNPDTASIATSFRKLIIILAIPSIVFSIFLVFLMGFITYTSLRTLESYEDERTVEVVVASTNLIAGAVLGYDNLGVKRFTQSKLQTKDYIIEDHAYVVMGYRIKKPLEINEPLTWHNTDIVITNKVNPSNEQKN